MVMTGQTDSSEADTTTSGVGLVSLSTGPTVMDEPHETRAHSTYFIMKLPQGPSPYTCARVVVFSPVCKNMLKQSCDVRDQ